MSACIHGSSDSTTCKRCEANRIRGYDQQSCDELARFIMTNRRRKEAFEAWQAEQAQWSAIYKTTYLYTMREAVEMLERSREYIVYRAKKLRLNKRLGSWKFTHAELERIKTYDTTTP